MKKSILLLFLGLSLSSLAQDNENVSVFYRLLLYNADQELLIVKFKDTDIWVTPGFYQDSLQFTKKGLRDVAATMGLTISDPQLQGIFTMRSNRNGKMKVSVRNMYASNYVGGAIEIPDNLGEVKWVSVKEGYKTLTYAHINRFIKQTVDYPDIIWGGAIDRIREGNKWRTEVIEEFYPLGKSKESKKATISSDSSIVRPIPIDKDALSGLGLKPVKNNSQPDRELFQSNLFIGEEIGVFVVASETATADWDNYTIDEFIFVLNGRARLNPKNAEEVFFNKGDFFVAPKGYVGQWETQGGESYYHELAVVALNRGETEAISGNVPVLLDKTKLSGIGATKKGAVYCDEVFKGIHLTATVEAEKSTTTELSDTKNEQLIYILAGKVVITAKDGREQTFQTNQFFVLPKGFSGIWKSQGHELFRSLRVVKTK